MHLKQRVQQLFIKGHVKGIDKDIATQYEDIVNIIMANLVIIDKQLNEITLSVTLKKLLEKFVGKYNLITTRIYWGVYEKSFREKLNISLNFSEFIQLVYSSNDF